MFVKELLVHRFRHLTDVRVGPFTEPTETSDLVVLGGPNGGGKTSVLELLSYALTNFYGWQFEQFRTFQDFSFSIMFGLTDPEIENATELLLQQGAQMQSTVDVLRQERGYWRFANPPAEPEPTAASAYGHIDQIASREFRTYQRRLGFFIRSDRVFRRRNYDRGRLFGYKQRSALGYFNNISFMPAERQYEDLYEFLLEQRYHHTYEIGRVYKAAQRGTAALSDLPLDPRIEYSSLFSQLFPGYGIADNEPEDFELRVRVPSGETIAFHELASGEQEVFFLAALFVRFDVRNSVVVVDEPDLHLHPDLARKLIRTLKRLRPGNQVWVATHSAEIIDDAGRERTYWFRRRDDFSSECVPATNEEREVELFRDLFGQSGYVGIAGRVVFVEGSESSADRRTFSRLFPALQDDIKLIPVGGKENLYRVNQAVLALLESAFARCQFYMIRDRDYLSEDGLHRHQGRDLRHFFILNRYHIENYLLDEEAISRILLRVYQKDLSPSQVSDELRSLLIERSGALLRDLTTARLSELLHSQYCSVDSHSETIAVVDSDGNWIPAGADPLATAISAKMAAIEAEVTSRLSAGAVSACIANCKSEFHQALFGSDQGWKSLFPARPLLDRFSRKLGLGDWPALQNLIIDELSTNRSAIPIELEQIMQQIVE